MPPLCLSGERKTGEWGRSPRTQSAARSAGALVKSHNGTKSRSTEKVADGERRGVCPDGTQRTRGQNRVPRVAGHASAKQTTKSRRAGALRKEYTRAVHRACAFRITEVLRLCTQARTKCNFVKFGNCYTKKHRAALSPAEHGAGTQHTAQSAEVRGDGAECGKE